MSNDATPSYGELTSETYTMFIDAFASANQRALEYAKKMWEVSARPYANSAFDAAVKEGFDRADAIVALTIAELQSSAHTAADLAERLAEQAAKLQETYTASLKGIVDISVSNLAFVKDTAEQRFEEVGKRVDDASQPSVASMSVN